MSEYSLSGPVAGNFYFNIYSPFVTDTYLCMFSRCLGKPFPGGAHYADTELGDGFQGRHGAGTTI